MNDYPRPFKLIRHTDVTGVSGTGVVAEGCQFTSGRIAIDWLGDYGSTVIWQPDSVATALEKVEKVHGHDGATDVVWIKAPIDAQFHPDVDEEPIEFVPTDVDTGIPNG